MKSVLLIVLFTPSVILASFTPGKEVDYNLFVPTSYTLNRTEWQIGLGPVWYGLTDNIMVGTNLWYILFLAPSFTGKINMLDELDGAPFGLGAALGFSQFPLGDIRLTSLGGLISVSKIVSPPTRSSNQGRMDLYLSMNLSQQWASREGEDTTVTSTAPMGSSVSCGIDYFTTENIRIVGDFLFTFPIKEENIETEGDLWFGGGAHMAWKNFNLKLGLLTSSGLLASDIPLKLIPQINLYWRFGGKPPTGN